MKEDPSYTPDFAAPVMWWDLLPAHGEKVDKNVLRMMAGTAPMMMDMNRHMQKMLDQTFNLSHFFMPWWVYEAGDLSIDIVESENLYRIEADISDREMRNIEIAVAKDALVISGESATVKIEENERYLRRERAGSSFSRTITLPQDADFDRARAVYEGNTVIIEVPRRRDERVKRKLEVVSEKLKSTPSTKSASGRIHNKKAKSAKRARK